MHIEEYGNKEDTKMTTSTVKKSYKIKAKEFFKKNWKKIAITGAGVTAVVGAGVIFAAKVKNGNSDGEEILNVFKNLKSMDPINYIVDDNGIRFEMSGLIDANGNVAQLAFNDVTANEVHSAIEYLNPDVWGVSSDQFKWDEIIFIKH